MRNLYAPPFKKPNTKATIIITICDLLYQELSESYPDESITYYRDAVYNYISKHYGNVSFRNKLKVVIEMIYFFIYMLTIGRFLA